MAEETGIAWCDSTANLWIGCTKVSGACDDCYAEDLMGTKGSRLKKVVWGRDGDRLRCAQGWNDLRKWQRAAARNAGVDPKLGRRRFVFINSLSDFFDNHRTVIWRPEAWALFRECTHLVLILVTKRPQLIRRELPDFWDEIAHRVYIVTTAEDQVNYDLRRAGLLESFRGRTLPGCIGLSIEPMLGPIDLGLNKGWCRACGAITEASIDGHCMDPASPCFAGECNLSDVITWVIVGGESGLKTRRPMHPDWVLSILRQCQYVGVAFFFKQWGTWLPASWQAEGEGKFHMLHEDTPPNTRVVLWPDGQVGSGAAQDHGGPGVAFLFQKPRDRLKLVEGKKPDATLQGRTYHQFPDERQAA